MRLLARSRHDVCEGPGVARFESPPLADQRGVVSVWDRFLSINGKHAYLAGNPCDTCSFLFERLEGANERVSIGPEDVAERLRAGLTELDNEVLDACAKLLDAGSYDVALLEVTPQWVFPGTPGDYFANEEPALWGIDSFWGLPHDPRVPYYRTDDAPVDRTARLFQFLAPLYPHTWLTDATVEDYRDRVRAGAKPTALALAALDVKQPAVWEGEPEVTCHWCLAHYLLDGHHKVQAAALERRPITLLSFVSREHGLAADEHRARALDVLAATST